MEREEKLPLREGGKGELAGRKQKEEPPASVDLGGWGLSLEGPGQTLHLQREFQVNQDS